MDLGITFAVLPAEADVAACRDRYFHYCSTGSYPTFTKERDGPGHPTLPGRRGGAYALNENWDSGTGICIDAVAATDKVASLTSALARAHDIMRQRADERIAEFPTAAHKAEIRHLVRAGWSQQQVRDRCAELRCTHAQFILNELEQSIRNFEMSPGPFLQAMSANDGECDWPAIRFWRFMRDCLDDHHTPWIGLHCMRDRGQNRLSLRPFQSIGIREIAPRFLEIMDTDRTWFYRL